MRVVPGVTPAGLALLIAAVALLVLTGGVAAPPAAPRASRADPLELLRHPGGA